MTEMLDISIDDPRTDEDMRHLYDEEEECHLCEGTGVEAPSMLRYYSNDPQDADYERCPECGGSGIDCGGSR